VPTTGGSAAKSQEDSPRRNRAEGSEGFLALLGMTALVEGAGLKPWRYTRAQPFEAPLDCARGKQG